MIKAANNFVQVEVKEQKGGFQAADPSLVEGKIISCGDNVTHFKKGQTVLFPSTHGKVMEHSIKGTKYYFIDKDVILAYE